MGSQHVTRVGQLTLTLGESNISPCFPFGTSRGPPVPQGPRRSPFFHAPPTKEAPINKLPTSVDELIDELDRLCPEVIPGAAEDMISIQRRAGKRELVVMLKHLRDRRNRPAPVQERKR